MRIDTICIWIATAHLPQNPVSLSPSPRQEPLTTEQLFGKRQEIVIVHDGEAYRLRITRNNKLILTK